MHARALSAPPLPCTYSTSGIAASPAVRQKTWPLRVSISSVRRLKSASGSGFSLAINLLTGHRVKREIVAAVCTLRLLTVHLMLFARSQVDVQKMLPGAIQKALLKKRLEDEKEERRAERAAEAKEVRKEEAPAALRRFVK